MALNDRFYGGPSITPMESLVTLGSNHLVGCPPRDLRSRLPPKLGSPNHIDHTEDDSSFRILDISRRFNGVCKGSRTKPWHDINDTFSIIYTQEIHIYIYIIWQYHDAIFIIDINLIVGVKDEIFPCGSWRDQCSSHTSNNQGQKNGSKRFWRWFYTPKKLTARTWKKWKVGRWVSFCQGIILAFWSVNFPMGFCKKSLTLANPVIVLDDDQGV